MKFDTQIQLVDPETQATLNGGVMAFGGDQQTFVTGFQKTIQMWLKALLTEEGSDVYDREYGTPFVRLIGSNVTSRSDVQLVVEQSIRKATEDVQRYQEAYPPDSDDEVLEDATIQSIVFSDDGTRVDISVFLENRSGRVLQVLIPTNL